VGRHAQDLPGVSKVWDREKGVIRLTCKETSAAIFTPDAPSWRRATRRTRRCRTRGTSIPPGTLTISSGTSELRIGADGTVVTRVRVNWPAIQDPRITTAGRWKSSGPRSPAASGTRCWSTANLTEAYLTGLSDGMAVLVRARTRTSVATSDWGLQQVHIVVGKTEPPAAPTGVSITQELVFFRRPATWTSRAFASAPAWLGGRARRSAAART
jgi:hypothetical protein